ncbi:MAG: hypothetical protein ACI4J4_07675, partial [Ruminiclostridium sp.]
AEASAPASSSRHFRSSQSIKTPRFLANYSILPKKSQQKAFSPINCAAAIDKPLYMCYNKFADKIVSLSRAVEEQVL